jgi:hypothetical protein
VGLLRVTHRVGAYLALVDDRHPSTDEAQSVRLEIDYPDARPGLNRWMPLVKVAFGHPALHRPVRAQRGRGARGDRRLVRDRLHGPYPGACLTMSTR